MKIQTAIVPVEWKAADDDPGTLEGYASTFNNIDYQHDVIAQGAFKNTLARVKAGDVPFLADHRASVRDVLGTLTDAAEDAKGLKIKVKFAADPDSQAVRQKMLDGHVSKMSIGYQALQWRYETRGESEDRVRVLEDIRLWEVSAVVFPANPEAVITTVKAVFQETVDAVVAGAVTAGGDEKEIKAALAEWAKRPLTDVAPGAVEPPGQPEKKSSTTEDTAHLETGDATKQPEGSEPRKADDGPDSLKLAMLRADAVLAGRDPDEVADPVKYAGTSARLEVLEAWTERTTREDELQTELDALRGR
jgi:uncharacterized protein